LVHGSIINFCCPKLFSTCKQCKACIAIIMWESPMKNHHGKISLQGLQVQGHEVLSTCFFCHCWNLGPSSLRPYPCSHDVCRRSEKLASSRQQPTEPMACFFFELPSSGDQLMLLQLAVAECEAAFACTVKDDPWNAHAITGSGRTVCVEFKNVS